MNGPRMKDADRRTAEDALEEAVEAAGGSTSTAQQLGITQPAVSQWLICPAARVLSLEAVSGVPRWRLRPDLHRRARCGMCGDFIEPLTETHIRHPDAPNPMHRDCAVNWRPRVTTTAGEPYA